MAVSPQAKRVCKEAHPKPSPATSVEAPASGDAWDEPGLHVLLLPYLRGHPG